MGTVCFSSSSIELVGRYTKKTNFKMMYKLCAALLFAGAAVSTPVPGHGGHNNLQCFSKPYKQCHKKPIQNQRQECHEEYDIIVDTTYIEECEEIVTTHCEEQHTQVHHSSQVVGHDSQKIHGGYSSGMERERLVTKVTLLDPTARTMLITSATRFPSRMRERCQERSARPLLTPPTLRNVRILFMRSVTRPMSRLTIAPRLLVMTPKLLIIIPMDMDMVINLFHMYLISSVEFYNNCYNTESIKI